MSEGDDGEERRALPAVKVDGLLEHPSCEIHPWSCDLHATCRSSRSSLLVLVLGGMLFFSLAPDRSRASSPMTWKDVVLFLSLSACLYSIVILASAVWFVWIDRRHQS